jgi:hypothetical protein
MGLLLAGLCVLLASGVLHSRAWYALLQVEEEYNAECAEE